MILISILFYIKNQLKCILHIKSRKRNIMYVKLEPTDKNLDIKVLVLNVLYGYFIIQII